MIIAVIVYILVGLVVGFLARLLLPGRDPIGILGTILLGIAGAVIGGFVWEALFGDNRGVSWIGSVLMAMLLLWIYRKMTYGRSVTA